MRAHTRGRERPGGTTGALLAGGSALIAAWSDLVLPASCAGCGTRGPRLCAMCAATLTAPAAVVRPDPAPRGLPVVRAVGPYAGALRSLVVAHKEHAAHAVAAPLGRALARSAHAALPPGAGPCGLVPVPSARAAVRARGHDATRCLARHAARELRVRGVAAQMLPVLVHGRKVADQVGLSGAQRVANVTGAMAVRGRLAPLFTGINVVIVDDLVTTGATLAEAARAVANAGGHVVGAAVIAATRRRGDDPAVRMSPGRRQASWQSDSAVPAEPAKYRGRLARPPPGAEDA